MSMMNQDTGETRDDLKMPTEEENKDLAKEMSEKIQKGEDFLVTVLNACGEEKIISTKVNTS